jgi:hypothetical protein
MSPSTLTFRVDVSDGQTISSDTVAIAVNPLVSSSGGSPAPSAPAPLPPASPVAEAPLAAPSGPLVLGGDAADAQSDPVIDPTVGDGSTPGGMVPDSTIADGSGVGGSLIGPPLTPGPQVGSPDGAITVTPDGPSENLGLGVGGSGPPPVLNSPWLSDTISGGSPDSGSNSVFNPGLSTPGFGDAQFNDHEDMGVLDPLGGLADSVGEIDAALVDGEATLSDQVADGESADGDSTGFGPTLDARNPGLPNPSGQDLRAVFSVGDVMTLPRFDAAQTAADDFVPLGSTGGTVQQAYDEVPVSADARLTLPGSGNGYLEAPAQAPSRDLISLAQATGDDATLIRLRGVGEDEGSFHLPGWEAESGETAESAAEPMAMASSGSGPAGFFAAVWGALRGLTATGRRTDSTDSLDERNGRRR